MSPSRPIPTCRTAVGIQERVRLEGWIPGPDLLLLLARSGRAHPLGGGSVHRGSAHPWLLLLSPTITEVLLRSSVRGERRRLHSSLGRPRSHPSQDWRGHRRLLRPPAPGARTPRLREKPPSMRNCFGHTRLLSQSHGDRPGQRRGTPTQSVTMREATAMASLPYGDEVSDSPRWRMRLHKSERPIQPESREGRRIARLGSLEPRPPETSGDDG
jgi:hypothetical protein